MNLLVSPRRRLASPPVARGRFVFGLWGGSPDDARWHAKTSREIAAGARLARRLRALCYGVGSHCQRVFSHAVGRRWPVERLEEVPLANHWGNKLRILKRALEVSPEGVVWLDCDARQLRDLPADFWARLHSGAPLQTAIRQYHRRKCHWRPSHPRTLCGGAFIYCREAGLIDRALEVMASNAHRGYDDEQSMAFVIDELNGGWKGLEDYNARFNPPWYTVNGIIFPPAEPVFTAS